MPGRLRGHSKQGHVRGRPDVADLVSPILGGIRVVEMTTGLAGPCASLLLAEAGADVIRLEPPGGDSSRTRTPAAHASWNRSKRSAVLEEGNDELLHGLLANSDVFVHGLTQAVARSRGLDNVSLAKRYPHLV